MDIAHQLRCRLSGSIHGYCTSTQV